MKARAAALAALSDIIIGGHALATVVAAHKEEVEARERPLFQELCYGVVRFYLPLSRTVDLLLDKPLPRKHADLRVLLLLGLYQLSRTRIPPHAVVMETVALAADLNKAWAKGLANAILRGYQRRRAALDAAIALDEEARFAHPAWLIARMRTAWGARAEALFVANNEAPPMTLRVNERRTNRDAYLALLSVSSIAAHAAAHSPSGIYLHQPCDVAELPGFADGLASVQDEAAQLAASLLALAPGQRVLDACAAPGGKAAHILELQPDLAELTALDIDAARLAMVAGNFARLGLLGNPILGDAAAPATWWDGRPYDRILLDAPCSGTGVIRRNPDIKLLRKETDVAKLASQQEALLEALWPLLKPGGMLLYATCSVLPEENGQVVAEFLRRTPDAKEHALAESWGEAAGAGLQLLPCSGANDGFYYSRLKKA